MKLTKFTRYIKSTVNKADNNISNTLGSNAGEFVNDLKMRAPVDKGDFKDSWNASSVSNSSGNKSVVITNDMVYGTAIEFGSIPGKSPWPSPGPKTVMSGGRIFSSQAVDGTIEKTFSKESIRDFTIEIANSILRAFK